MEVPSGLDVVGLVPWGTHLCHFYRTAEDLVAALVPYFQAGLENNDQCLWVTAEPLDANAARAALLEAVPDLETYESGGQIEIIDHHDWYTRQEDMDAQQVLASWIAAEEAARANGRNGLRLTGNTFWLERKDWAEFAEYEAAVHEAFATRKILAVCSYSLDKCTSDDVVEVLRSHDFALLYDHGHGEVISSATQLVASVNAFKAAPPHDHTVHFYSSGSYPADAIATFLAEAIGAGRPAAAITTAPHRDDVEAALRARGADPSQVRFFNAEEIVATCSPYGPFEVSRARPLLEEMFEELCSTNAPTHLYGEVVDVLSARGETAAAVALEQAWNEMLHGRSEIALFCGYDLSVFEAHEDVDGYLAVCRGHGDVSIHADSRSHDFLARALVREMSHRRKVEVQHANRGDLEHAASRRLAHLQRVTAALSEVLHLRELPPVVEREICGACGASKATLALCSPGDDFSFICHVGHDEEADTSAMLEALAAVYRREQGWFATENVLEAEWGAARLPDVSAIAVLPLRAAGRSAGFLALCFETDQQFDVAQRALIEDISDQVALASDRARLYEETEAKRRQIEKASTAKDEFLAMLGHELRNPLAAIQTASELLKFTSNDEAVLRSQRVLERQAKHMARLLDGLLDVSRIARGKISLHKQPVDLREVLQKLLHDRFDAERSSGFDLHVELGAQPVYVNGDVVRLTQVFDNLLSNAIKYTPTPGTISITLAPGEDDAMLSVRDTGVGISPELLPHVFDPFQQGPQGLSRPGGGLGLGLAVVKALVDLHGGAVTAQSDGPDRGSEFRVRLPLHMQPALENTSHRPIAAE